MKGNNEVSCQVLAGTNKTGNLRQNERGYWPMIVGALNMVNNKNEYYSADYGRKFFTEGSDLWRMSRKGVLKGEEGHPEQGNLDEDRFVERLLRVDEKSVVCLHHSLDLDYDNFKDDKGVPFIGIVSEVGPSGYYGPALEKSLKDPNEEVCFSIRCFSMPHRVGGRIVREMRHAVTFDRVTEPGIKYATKYHSPTLESHSEKVFSDRSILKAARNIRNAPGSNESNIISVDTFLASMGLEVRDSPQARRNYMELLNTHRL